MNAIITNRKLWFIPLAIWSAIVLASYGWSISELNVHVRQLAADRARFAFQMVESMRLWNARHGGVYVAVAEDTQPNPYLEVFERDIVTPSGMPLTMVNPAFMTRQLTDVVLEISGLILHITSLNPLNPGNAADPWEQAALQSFEQGVAEVGEFTGRPENSLYRYMAPLRTMKACLQCHERQGYKVGDIRGGISISYPARQLLASAEKQKRNVVLIHVAVWFLFSGMTLYALSGWRRQMVWLKEAKQQQDLLVERQTNELRSEVRERRQAEDRLRLVIESSGEGIYGVDPKGRCTLINARALELLAFASETEVIGQDLHALIHQCEGDCALVNTYRRGTHAHAEADEFLRADGERFAVEYRSYPIWQDDRLAGAVVTFADITARREMQQQVWRQANYDSLTGLANRSLFADRIEQAIREARRKGSGFAVFFLDLDRFKMVNDTLGHDAGDALLKEVAARIVSTVRTTDTVARMGGDEFTLLLPGIVAKEQAARIARKILEQLARPLSLSGRTITVSGSIGIVLYPEHADDVATLLKYADISMYAAKQGGRNGFRIYGLPNNDVGSDKREP